MFNKLKNMSSKAMTVLKFIIISVLVVSLVVGSTYAWFITNLTTSVNNGDEYITVSADAGLKLSYGEEFETQGEIIIQRQAPDAVLSECSSVDGRNIFFPISDYSKIEHTNNNNEFVNDVNTEELIFREATANDKNNKYISFDFEISAASSTDIWLSNRSYITGTAADAIRISFDLHNGKAPIVIDNTPATYANTNYAVETINTSGQKLTTVEQKPLAIGDYVNNGNNKTPLFTLDAGEDMIVTMTIWLEGTDPECTEAVLSQEDLQINIEFSTVVEDLNSVTFIDRTLEKWVEDTESKVFAQDANNESMLYSMTKSESYDNTWTVDLPIDVTNINFVRKDPNSSSGEWNYWNAGEIDNSRVYNALGHGGGVWGANLETEVVTFIDNTYDDSVFSKTGYDYTQNRMRVSYTYNGSVIGPYKASYQSSVGTDACKRNNVFRVVVPKGLDSVTFTSYESSTSTSATRTWTASNKIDGCTFFAATSSSGGYWGSKLLYAKPDSSMTSDGAYLSSYFFIDDNNYKWAAAGKSNCTYDGNTYNIFVVPNGYDNLIFVRTNPDGAPSWTNKWNQTGDITISGLASKSYNSAVVKLDNQLDAEWHSYPEIDAMWSVADR